MSQKIQIRRGSDSARLGVTFDAGEPVYTTDNKKMYIGDGSTAGGISVGTSLSSNNCVVVETTSSFTGNGVNLITAFNSARALSPSIANPVTILIPPSIYEIRNQIILDSGYISFVGLGNRENTIIRGGVNSGSPNTSLFRQTTATDIIFKDVTLQGIDSGTLPIQTIRLSASATRPKLIFDSVIIDHSGTNSSSTILSNTSIHLGATASTPNRIEATNCKFFGEWSPHPYGENGAPILDSSFIRSYFSGNCNPYFPANNTLFKDCVFASLTGFSVREDGSSSFTALNRYENCFYSRPDGFYFKHDIPGSLGSQFQLQSVFSNCYIDGQGSTGLYNGPHIINSTIINRNTGVPALQYISPSQEFQILDSTILNTFNGTTQFPAITGNNVSGNIASCVLNSNISGIGNRVLTPNNAIYTGIMIPQTTV